MCISIQPLIGLCGLQKVNMNMNSLTSRMLFTVIPSELYAGDLTLDVLLAALAKDLGELYENGASVAFA
ncbi:unnamed protein product [Symbiodinium microadriaticum]|nr:unnamed protein product [Symbiodinium microadriaticum]